MAKDRLLELHSNQIEIRGGLGSNAVQTATSSSTPAVQNPKRILSKKGNKSQKTVDDIFKETQQVRAWLEAIEEETKLVKRLHTVILNSPRPEPETKDKLMNAMIKIKTLSLRVRSSLKTLERKLEEKLSPVESRMVSVQHSTLLKRFQMAMADYQGALAQYKDQTEAFIKSQLRIVIQSVMRRPAVLAGYRLQTTDELERLLDRETTQVFVDNYVHESQVMKLALQDANLRHKEMLELEKSIKELHELFTDMAVMVHAQGEMINVIEYNVERGTSQVTEGNQEMSQAYENKKSARKKKMWCLFLLLCIIGIVFTYAALHALITSIFTL